MREIRPSGSEGGVADNGHPYPYNPGRSHLSKNSRVVRVSLVSILPDLFVKPWLNHLSEGWNGIQTLIWFLNRR